MSAKLTEARFEKLANELARREIGEIYPCAKCGHPVIRGFVCSYCGDRNPSERPKNKARTA